MIPAHFFRGDVLPCGDALAHFSDLDEFGLAVGGEDFPRFLETLVRHLLKRDIVAGLEGGAAATGADWVFVVVVEEETFFAASGDGVGIEGGKLGRDSGGSVFGGRFVLS